MSRRAVLLGGGALAATAIGTAAVGRLVGRRRFDAQRDLLLELAEQLGISEIAPALGERYLLDHPAEADPRTLLERLLPAGAEPDGKALRRSLVERIEREYAAREVVEIDGWVLARSEARLLALFTLLGTPESHAG